MGALFATSSPKFRRQLTRMRMPKRPCDVHSHVVDVPTTRRAMFRSKSVVFPRRHTRCCVACKRGSALHCSSHSMVRTSCQCYGPIRLALTTESEACIHPRRPVRLPGSQDLQIGPKHESSRSVAPCHFDWHPCLHRRGALDFTWWS